MAINGLIVIVVAICVMMLSLEIGLSGRKVWTYFLKKDGKGKEIFAYFIVVSIFLQLIMMLGRMPESSEYLMIYAVVPFLLALMIKSRQLSKKSEKSMKASASQGKEDE